MNSYVQMEFILPVVFCVTTDDQTKLKLTASELAIYHLKKSV
jgi:hypothetical protein